MDGSPLKTRRITTSINIINISHYQMPIISMNILGSYCNNIYIYIYINIYYRYTYIYKYILYIYIYIHTYIYVYMYIDRYRYIII